LMIRLIIIEWTRVRNLNIELARSRSDHLGEPQSASFYSEIVDETAPRTERMCAVVRAYCMLSIMIVANTACAF
jgi:hypothetical protein